jgi:hypothetical protein
MHEINFYTEKDITAAFQVALFIVCYRSLVSTRSLAPTVGFVVAMLLFSKAGWQAFVAPAFALPATLLTMYCQKRSTAESEGVLRFYFMFGEPALAFLLLPVYVEETKVLLGPLLLVIAWGMVHALFPPSSKDTATLFLTPILCCILLTAMPELLWITVSAATGCQLIYVAASKSLRRAK